MHWLVDDGRMILRQNRARAMYFSASSRAIALIISINVKQAPVTGSLLPYSHLMVRFWKKVATSTAVFVPDNLPTGISSLENLDSMRHSFILRRPP